MQATLKEEEELRFVFLLLFLLLLLSLWSQHVTCLSILRLYSFFLFVVLSNCK